MENQQILTIARIRAEAEEQYSSKLGDIAPSVDRMTSGFMRDDGASVRKVGFFLFSFFPSPPCSPFSFCLFKDWVLIIFRPMKVFAPKWKRPPKAIER